MSDFGFEFDASEVEDEGFGLIPDAVYDAFCEVAEARLEDKDGNVVQLGPNGEGVERVYKVTARVQSRIKGPAYANRVISDWFLLKSGDPNDKKKVGRGGSAFARLLELTTGKKSTRTPKVIENKEYQIQVGHWKPENGDPRNQVKAYKKSAGAIPVGAGAAPAAPGAVPSWLAPKS